jgi:hypothetical protein
MDLVGPSKKELPSYKMSLSRFIHHKTVGKPTYFDLLPADVLRHHLIPFLGWEDRIHINMLTPPGDRTPPKKIPKLAIAAHQLSISAIKVRAKLKAFEEIQYKRARSRSGPSLTTEVSAIIDVLDTVASGHNMVICQYSSAVRNVIEEKLEELSRPDQLKKVPRIAQRKQLQESIAKLITKLIEYPLLQDKLAKKTWLRAMVYTNETALLHEATGSARGIFYQRSQGDIYSELE